MRPQLRHFPAEPFKGLAVAQGIIRAMEALGGGRNDGTPDNVPEVAMPAAGEAAAGEEQVSEGETRCRDTGDLGHMHRLQPRARVPERGSQAVVLGLVEIIPMFLGIHHSGSPMLFFDHG